MKALIVDDEEPARQEIDWLLQQCDNVTVVGEASNAREAREALDDPETGNAVDIVFLDIDMPGVDGIRLAECLQDLKSPPLPVFVTAYEEFAVEAFDVEAVDYLLKPVRLERLQKAVARARTRLEARRGATATDEDSPQDSGSTDPLERISIEAGSHYEVVDVGDILFFESADGEVFARTADGRQKTDFSLKFLEANLPSEDFFRCHRSYIVRLDAVSQIQPAGAGTYELHLSGAAEREDGAEPDDRSSSSELSVPLARSRAAEFKRRIPWSSSVVD